MFLQNFKYQQDHMASQPRRLHFHRHGNYTVRKQYILPAGFVLFLALLGLEVGPSLLFCTF
jgi:hypothetical protein